MTNAVFDTIIHAPNHLQICVLLEAKKEIALHIIREQLYEERYEID